MPADLTPEALDALIERLREADTNSPQRIVGSRIFAEAADTIAALRAAPVAMRERIARAEDEAYARGEMGNPGHRIRALPLDAPAPVDPVVTGGNAATSAAFWAGHAAGVRGEDVELAWLTQPDRAPVDPVTEAARVLRGDAVMIASMFHEAYESLAPVYGYETRHDTRDFDPTSPNGKLMIATCEAVMNALSLRALAQETRHDRP